MPKSEKSPEKAHLGTRLAQAKKIKEQAEAREISQAEIARHFKVSEPTVSADWLKKGRIAKKHYPGLVEYFGLPYEWWFGDASADKKITEVFSLMLRMSDKGKEETLRAAKEIAKRRSTPERHKEVATA